MVPVYRQFRFRPAQVQLQLCLASPLRLQGTGALLGPRLLLPQELGQLPEAHQRPLLLRGRVAFRRVGFDFVRLQEIFVRLPLLDRPVCVVL
jgi:hypothetical protein